MTDFAAALRCCFGLFWIVFGLNGFLHFFAIPQPTPEGAAFMQALAANMLMYDWFLNPSGLTLGLAVAGMYAALLYHYRRSFAPLLAR